MDYTFLIAVVAVVLIVLAIASFTNFGLDDEHYDRLKWVVTKWAYLVTFIGILAKTFEIPYGVETVTVVAGFGAMLAGLLDISNAQYESRQKLDDDFFYDEEYIDDGDDGEEE